MSYLVKELFVTLQGEGRNAGRASVFCRFSRCNLWSGRERDRPSAVCKFCDTDFVGTDGEGGGKFPTADSLAAAAGELWMGTCEEPGRSVPLVVCTGGEPLLQLDEPLLEAFHSQGFEVAIETNGTLPVPPGVDWVCVSPKEGADLVVLGGDELKLVFPQDGAPPERFASLGFSSFYLQPMDGPEVADHTKAAIDYCLAHPQWKLSVQTHKHLGIR
jgi:7-carboxy-7-deazaguanine synthase